MQRVKVGTKKSPELPVTSGVPQGSILGPLLFPVFMNSLPKVVTTSSIYMFADDTKIISSNPMELQQDLDRFVQWCDHNKMEVNVEKTHLMMFRGDDSQKFRMMNVNLQTSPFERDLGVVISEDLSWFEQTKTRCNKAYRAFFNLKRNISPLSSLCSRLNMYCGCRFNFDTLFSSLACKQEIHERTRTGTEESNELDLQNISSRLQNPLDPTEAVTN